MGSNSVDRINFVDPTKVTGLVSAKGDLITSPDGSGLTTLSAGSNGQILKANSAAPGGIEWDDENGGTQISDGFNTGVTLSAISGFTGSATTANTYFIRVGQRVTGSVIIRGLSVAASTQVHRFRIPAPFHTGNFGDTNQAGGGAAMQYTVLEINEASLVVTSVAGTDLLEFEGNNQRANSEPVTISGSFVYTIPIV